MVTVLEAVVRAKSVAQRDVANERRSAAAGCGMASLPSSEQGLSFGGVASGREIEMHDLDPRRPIPDCTDDLERLNERTLELLRDPMTAMHARCSLEVTAPVAERVASASPQGLCTAIRCGVPLLIFTPAFEEMLGARSRHFARIGVGESPRELEGLALFTLNFAHQLVLRNPSIAHAFFGLSRGASESFAEMPVVHREGLSRRARGLLKVRAGGDLAVWDGLLMGDHCADGRAQLMACARAYRTLFQR